MNDLLIKGCLVYDGSGEDPAVQDILVKQGKIAAVGHVTECQDDPVLDAKGLAAMPALVSVSDAEDTGIPALQKDTAFDKLLNGYLYTVTGVFGTSSFPRSVSQITALRNRGENASEKEKWQAGTLSKLIKKLPDAGFPLSIIPFTGYSALRKGVIGPIYREAWPDEIKLEEYLLAQTFEQGSCGFSVDFSTCEGRSMSCAEIDTFTKLCYIWDRTMAVSGIDSVEKEKAERIMQACRANRTRVYLKDSDECGLEGIDAHCACFDLNVWFSAEEVIYANSELLQSFCGFKNRGTIVSGAYADILLCSREEISGMVTGKIHAEYLLLEGEYIVFNRQIIARDKGRFILR